METLKSLLSKRWFQISIAVVATGIITSLFLQETIIRKEREESSQRICQFQKDLIATQEKLLLAERQLSTHQRTDTERTTKPDGTIIEKIIVVTDTELVEKVRQEEKQKAETRVAQLENEVRELKEKSEVIKNPKRITVFASVDMNPNNERTLIGGFQYKLWGPLTVGAVVSSIGQVGPAIGLSF